MKLRHFTLIALAVLATVPAMAQKQYRIPIAIDATGSDPAGQAYVYNLKEQLSRSAIFSYGAAEGSHFLLHIVTCETMAAPASLRDHGSAASIVLVIADNDGEYYIDQWAISIPYDSASTLTQQLIASLSADMDTMRKALAATPKVNSSVKAY